MADLRQFSNTGSGFGQAAYDRARAAGLSDSQIRSSLASSGLTIGAKVKSSSGSGGVDLRQFSNTGTGFGQAAYNRALSSGLNDSQIRSSLASSGLTIGAKVAQNNQEKPTGPVPIDQLNAYSMAQIQQSLNEYNTAKNAPRSTDSQGRPTGWRFEGTPDYLERQQYKAGSNYGIEDEYRYMQSKGFVGAGNAPVAPAPAPAPTPAPTSAPAPQTPTNPYQAQIDAASAQAAQFATILSQMQQGYASRAASDSQAQQQAIDSLRNQQDARYSQLATMQREATAKLEQGQRTYQQNQSRSGQVGALQIGGATETPRTGGTQGFKRRKLQINPVTANALENILGGTAATTKTNVLNV
jgi:hypothetical protein